MADCVKRRWNYSTNKTVVHGTDVAFDGQKSFGEGDLFGDNSTGNSQRDAFYTKRERQSSAGRSCGHSTG